VVPVLVVVWKQFMGLGLYGRLSWIDRVGGERIGRAADGLR